MKTLSVVNIIVNDIMTTSDAHCDMAFSEVSTYYSTLSVGLETQSITKKTNDPALQQH